MRAWLIPVFAIAHVGIARAHLFVTNPVELEWKPTSEDAELDSDLLASDPISFLESSTDSPLVVKYRGADAEPTGGSSHGTDSELSTATRPPNSNFFYGSANTNLAETAETKIKVNKVLEERRGHTGVPSIDAFGDDAGTNNVRRETIRSSLLGGAPLDARPEDGVSSRLVAPQDQATDGSVRDGILVHEDNSALEAVPLEARIKDPQDKLPADEDLGSNNNKNDESSVAEDGSFVDTTRDGPIDPKELLRGKMLGSAAEEIPADSTELGGGRGVMGRPGGNYAGDKLVNGRNEWSFDPTVPNKFDYGVDFHDSIDPYEHEGSRRSSRVALRKAKRKHARMFHAHKPEE